MSDKIKISIEEKAILVKLQSNQLRFLAGVDDSPEKERLVEIIQLLIGREKEIFFQENSVKYTPDQLYALHNLSRGHVMAYTMLFHLIRAAKYELDRRASEKQDKREEE